MYKWSKMNYNLGIKWVNWEVIYNIYNLILWSVSTFSQFQLNTIVTESHWPYVGLGHQPSTLIITRKTRVNWWWAWIPRNTSPITDHSTKWCPNNNWWWATITDYLDILIVLYRILFKKLLTVISVVISHIYRGRKGM